MSFRVTEQTESFKEAIKAVEQIDPPAAGFSKTVAGSSSNQAIIIKQNNLIIQLLARIAEETQHLKEELTEAKRGLNSLLKAKETKQDTSEALEVLGKKLEELKIGGEVIKRKKGPFFVFEDPKKIFEREKAKWYPHMILYLLEGLGLPLGLPVLMANSTYWYLTLCHSRRSCSYF